MQPSLRMTSTAPRVLIADADIESRTLHRNSLSEAGCDVLEAADGRDALVKALVRQPSLVMADLDLPLVDGISLCEILRRDRVTQHVPILVLTDEASPARIAAAKRAGADALLTKATALQTLLAETERLLSASREVRGRSAAATRKVTEELKRSAMLLEHASQNHRTVLSRTHQRFMTVTPPIAPPELRCPICDHALKYTTSHIGGVSAEYPEQWDYFTCDVCGEFRYRQRTRKLRQLP